MFLGLAAIAAWGALAGDEDGSDRYEEARSACQAVVDEQRGRHEVLRVTNEGETNTDVIITLGYVGSDDEFACRTSSDGTATAEVWRTGQ